MSAPAARACAALASELTVVDHLRARPFRELDRVVRDHARAAGHEHRLAGDRAVGKQAAMRGHDRDAEARAVLER